MWAAITAELARNRTSGFPDYLELGKKLREEARFVYLFPAERKEDRWLAWLPFFECGKGLGWYREDSFLTLQNGVPDRIFRFRLLDARPSTAIDSDSGTAADGTLHETECINMHWRTDAGGAVALVGYVFLRSGDEVVQEISKVDALSLGGDTRYGMGRMCRVEWENASDIFGVEVNSDANTPRIRSNTVFAHTLQHAGEPEVSGALESLAGWDLTRNGGDRFTRFHEEPLWSPGSCSEAKGSMSEWEVAEYGYWQRPTK
ncbi:MAG: hypothetical protein ACLQU2_18420 [Candidatus Binataceae bacterium]